MEIHTDLKSTFEYEYLMAGRPHPMPAEMKRAMIMHYARKSGARTLIETGMYKAETTLAMAPHFDRVFSIEISKAMIDRLNTIGCPPNVTTVHGRSQDKLPLIMDHVEGVRVFWLDAHGATWGHEFGEKQEADVPACSLLEELDVVFARRHSGDVLLIDDADIFGTYGWPPLSDIGDRFEREGLVVHQEALVLVCEIPNYREGR